MTAKGLHIPRNILDSAKIYENDEVEFIPQEHEIIIRLSIPKEQTLERLFEGWDGNPPEKIEWFEQAIPIGSEIL